MKQAEQSKSSNPGLHHAILKHQKVMTSQIELRRHPRSQVPEKREDLGRGFLLVKENFFIDFL